MKFRPFLLIALSAVFSAAGFAQGGINPSHVSLRIGAGADRISVSREGAAASAAIRVLEKDTFQLINAERGLAGLGPLKWCDKVAGVARLHSNNMAERNFFSHKGLDGLMVHERAAQLDMGAWRAIGENIAFMKGYANPAETAVQKWLQSSSHRGNMLNPQWTAAAIGLAVTADGKYYFTQVFMR